MPCNAVKVLLVFAQHTLGNMIGALLAENVLMMTREGEASLNASIFLYVTISGTAGC